MNEVFLRWRSCGSAPDGRTTTARPQSESLRPVIDNERVTVWSLKPSTGEITTQMHACVSSA